MSLSIDELRAFVVAAELGSVGRAARALGVTQSALSKRIKGLEARGGTPLLERGAAGVRLSLAGQGLLEEARRVVEQADALEARLSARVSVAKPISVAASPAMAERVVPAAIMMFEPGQPAVPIELLVANSSDVLEAVQGGRVDIGIAAVDLDERLGEGAHLLGDDELVVVMPDDDRWCALDAVPVSDLVSRRLVLRDPGSHARQLLERAVAHAGLSLATPLLEVGNPAAIKAAVRASRAPGVLSRHAVGISDPGLVVRSIDGVDVRRRFWVLVAPGAAPAAAGIVERLLAHPLP